MLRAFFHLLWPFWPPGLFFVKRDTYLRKQRLKIFFLPLCPPGTGWGNKFEVLILLTVFFCRFTMPTSSLLQPVLRMCVKIWSLLRPDDDDHVRDDDDDDGGDNDDDCVQIGCGWRGADLKSYQAWGTGVREWSWCAHKTKLLYQKGKIYLQFCWTNAAPSLAEELTSLKLIFCKTFHTSWIEKPESNVNTKF